MPQVMTDRIIADLHCHTYRSGDCLMRPERLLAVARRRGIDRLAVTDHNNLEGALEAHSMDPDRIIVGEEIWTTQGELLGYYLTEPVPAKLSPMETIERLRAQGAVISVSHPLDPMRGGAWDEAELREILPYVDAVEVFNARGFIRAANRRAAELAREFGLPGTAGSDSHAYLEVGRTRLRLPAFTDAEGMRAALQEAEVLGRLSSPFVHFFSRWAAFRKRYFPPS